MNINNYCSNFDWQVLNLSDNLLPWEVLGKLEDCLLEAISSLGSDYTIVNNIAIHSSAKVDPTAQIKPPALIGPDCFIGPGVLLRGGVYLGKSVIIGPTCEVKSSIVCSGSAVAHFNYVGDSIIGSGVDLEAGAMVVNYYNEREDKEISVFVDGAKIDTGVIKFGAIIGDNTKIGANAVIAPGTILDKNSIVKRLELIDQSQQP